MPETATPPSHDKPFAAHEPAHFGFKDITYEKKDWVATIAFNRPKYYNAYSTLALQEMVTALQDASWDDGIAVVVLTGVGHIAFCTGGDVKDYAATYTKQPRQYYKWMGLFAQVLDTLRNVGKPTIARLNGMAVGGGNEMNMACDLAIAASHVKIRQVGTRVGSVACGGATQWLPLMIGDRRARQMLLLCEEIDAHRAFEWGLVNQVVPSVMRDGKLIDSPTPSEVDAAMAGKDGASITLEPLDRAIADMARRLVDKFPECLRYTRTQTNFWKDLSWHMTVGHARDWLSLHFNSPEPHEGMRSFVEKRPPDYRGLRERARDDQGPEFLHGAPLVTCPSCKTSGLPAEFAYCGLCGTRIDA